VPVVTHAVSAEGTTARSCHGLLQACVSALLLVQYTFDVCLCHEGLVYHVLMSILLHVVYVVIVCHSVLQFATTCQLSPAVDALCRKRKFAVGHRGGC
jgi:hypothetical protein